MRKTFNRCRRAASVMRTGVALVVFLHAVNVECANGGTFMGAQLNTRTPICGLVFPLCAENTSIPSARLFMEEIHVEKRRLGNLIIGIAPRIVIQGMKMEIMERKDSNGCWSLLHNLATKEAAINMADIRGFEVSCQNNEAPFVRAETAGFNALDATLQLHGVSIYKGGRLIAFIKSAAIATAGSHAGELVWKDGANDRNLPLVPSKPTNPPVASMASS